MTTQMYRERQLWSGNESVEIRYVSGSFVVGTSASSPGIPRQIFEKLTHSENPRTMYISTYFCSKRQRICGVLETQLGLVLSAESWLYSLKYSRYNSLLCMQANFMLKVDTMQSDNVYNMHVHHQFYTK